MRQVSPTRQAKRALGFSMNAFGECGFAMTGPLVTVAAGKIVWSLAVSQRSPTSFPASERCVVHDGSSLDHCSDLRALIAFLKRVCAARNHFCDATNLEAASHQSHRLYRDRGTLRIKPRRRSTLDAIGTRGLYCGERRVRNRRTRGIHRDVYPPLRHGGGRDELGSQRLCRVSAYPWDHLRPWAISSS